MPDPKITFAEGGGPAIGWIEGLPLTVSPGASDLLAAFHLAHKQTMEAMMAMIRPSVPQVPLPDGSGGLDGLDEDLMPDMRGYSPMANPYLTGLEPIVPGGVERAEDHPAYQEIQEELRRQGVDRSSGEVGRADAGVEEEN